MVVSALLLTIRDTLGDANGDRWNDDNLIRRINQAQRDINFEANLIRASMPYNLVPNTAIFPLDAEVLNLTRVTLDGVKLTFKSHEEMDEIDSGWETTTTTTNEIEYIVYDKVNRNQFRIYPVLETETILSSDDGIVISIDEYENSLSSDYGVVVSIEDPFDISGLNLYYTKRLSALVDTTDVLELDDNWENAIKHYVCGNALRDNKDTVSIEIGNGELQLYANELSKAKKSSSRNFRKSVDHITQYRRT